MANSNEIYADREMIEEGEKKKWVKQWTDINVEWASENQHQQKTNPFFAKKKPYIPIKMIKWWTKNSIFSILVNQMLSSFMLYCDLMRAKSLKNDNID